MPYPCAWNQQALIARRPRAPDIVAAREAQVRPRLNEDQVPMLCADLLNGAVRRAIVNDKGLPVLVLDGFEGFKAAKRVLPAVPVQDYHDDARLRDHGR